MMQASLRTRIKRLEALGRIEANSKPFLLCLYHTAEPPSDIVGVQSMFGLDIVERHSGEELEAFTNRASHTLGERYMLALYENDITRQ